MGFLSSLLGGSSKDNPAKAEKKDSRKSPRETGGPVVKTGPTAGQNRSRNQDGQWRAKRSDTGKKRS